MSLSYHTGSRLLIAAGVAAFAWSAYATRLVFSDPTNIWSWTLLIAPAVVYVGSCIVGVYVIKPQSGIMLMPFVALFLAYLAGGASYAFLKLFKTLLNFI